jgi:hypothetical protein
MFVVYLVTYSGMNLSAKFYIGSSSKDKVLLGSYFGSIKSKKWKNVYQQELRNNPNAFRIKILSEWNTRKDALTEELRLHKEHDVVNSLDYFNESLASPNGYFGRTVTGEDHPSYGKSWTEESRLKASESAKNRPPISDETRAKMSKSHKGRKATQETIDKRREKLIGKKRTEDSKQRMSDAQKGNSNRKGVKVSKETKERLREANIGKTKTNMTKKKMSDAARLAWVKRKERKESDNDRA